jgi:hypothetical protein
MIRRSCFWVLLLALSAWLTCGARAETFKLSDGTVLEGEPIGPNAQSVVIRKPDGSFSDRILWGKFSQEALKKFDKIPAIKRLVEPFLEPDEEQLAAKKAKPEIPFNPPPRFDRPDAKAGLGSLFSSSIGLVMLLILYAANLYAAYEVSLFRNYHPGLVCGLAAVMPVLTQITFLCVPTRVRTSEELGTQEATPDNQYVPPPVPIDGVLPTEEGAVTPAPSAPAHPPPTVYQRGQTTFNRRFFETKLAGFLRVVPSEEDKDMVLEVTSLRGQHVTQRIVRIMPNELLLQIQKGTASEEVHIPYAEIREIQVRHKDA